MTYLDVEEEEEMYKLFEGREEETSLFVGQLNEYPQDGSTVMVRIIVTARPAGYDAIVRYTEDIGSTILPVETTTEELKPLYNKRKSALEKLNAEVEARRKELTAHFKDKGFTVYRGVWSA